MYSNSLQAQTLATQLATEGTTPTTKVQNFSNYELLVNTLKDENPMKKLAHWRIRPTIAA
jgi:hypothetical protein